MSSTFLEGHVAVVTGGAQGIGLAIAQLFVRHGAAVVIADLNEAGARDAAAAIVAAGGRAEAIRTDVRVPGDVDAAVDRAVASFGRLDAMVNNAGVPRDAPLAEMSLETWQEVVDVHLRGAWLGTKAAGRIMCPQKRGSIVNMSSVSGKVGFPGQTNYSAAKAGIVGLTKAAAKELGPHNVRVNAIQPGTIRTERTANIPAADWALKVAEVPLRREGTPEEIAAVALFFASDLSSYVTGATIEVAGGRFM